MRSLFAWLVAAFGIVVPASADSPELEARLVCEAVPAPGRVRCDLALAAPAGSALTWADALVVSSPSFARPLRSRVTPRERRPSASQVELPFALVAIGAGRGELGVRARGVLCRAALCRPVSRDVSTELAVGQRP